MKKSIKWEIIKMFIPIIGFYWILKRLVSFAIKTEITWWDTGGWAPVLILPGSVIYQIICISIL